MRHVKNSKSYPLLNDEAWLRQKREVEKKPLKEIAVEVGGCSPALVCMALKKFSISGPDAGESQRGRAKKKSFPELYDKEWLAARQAEGMGGTEIARLLGCSFSMACRAVRAAELVEKPPADPTSSPYYGQSSRLKDVAWMKDQYIIRRRKAKHIADEIGVTMWNVFDALERLGIAKFPSKRTGIRKKRTTEGYIKIRVVGHPCGDGRGYVLEHRLVAEKALGYYLDRDSNVHHINEVRDDNREENLLVLPDFATHMYLHNNPPPWVPYCEEHKKHCPELIAARPAWVPLLFDIDMVYAAPPNDYVMPKHATITPSP